MKAEDIRSKYHEFGLVLKQHSSMEGMDSGCYHIGDLIEMLQEVQKDCGANSYLSMDAGHNNINFEVIPSKAKPANCIEGRE